MKKFILFALVVLTGLASSCKYDDDELWENVNDLANRLTTLETATKQMNNDIASLQSIVSALQNQVTVSDVETLTDGYVIHFSDGTKATIKNGENGKDGEAGKDGETGKDGKDGLNAPVINVAKENGVYYWTMTIDGNTEWLTDEAGNKMPVSGTDGESGSNGLPGVDGVTPLLRVNANCWEVSYDGGKTYEEVKDIEGNSVEAKGEKGDSMFESVEEGEGVVIITLADGKTKYELPMATTVTYKDKDNKEISANDISIATKGSITLTYDVPQLGKDYSVEVLKEEGVSVTVGRNKQLTITANGSMANAKAVVIYYNATQTITSVLTFKEAWTDNTKKIRMNSQYYETIQAAVNVANDGAVIEISSGDYNEVINVTGDKNLTIQPANEGDVVTIAGIDHQTNGNPSIIVVNNLTIDNSLAEEGWFIGTAQNLKVCVGAWGGYLTFNGCKFIVSGESKAETGVMTWWTTNKMSLTFNDCTFEGKDNHASARAMQIYGNADLTVTDCTFNTYKDYSLKYVAEEGNVATFEENKVNNSKYFVQLGSGPYPGNNYKVEINNTTLGEGVAHYYIDNEENQVIYIDGSAIAYNAAALASLLTANEKNIAVKLAEDIDIPITSLGSQTPGSGEYKLGGESTETITIDLNDKKLNITTTYWSGIGAKNDDVTISIKNGTMTSSQATGTWNSYDVTFANCNYVIEDVDFEKAIAFTNAGKNVEMNGVTINETHDYYALWISAKGQTIEIDGLTIDSEGRGIKIDDQYVDTPEEVTLKVSNATFETKNKAAILVKSTAGADITLENVNIEKVEADKVNAVWCDEDGAEYNDLIIVTGGTKIIEGQ